MGALPMFRLVDLVRRDRAFPSHQFPEDEGIQHLPFTMLQKRHLEYHVSALDEA